MKPLEPRLLLSNQKLLNLNVVLFKDFLFGFKISRKDCNQKTFKHNIDLLNQRICLYEPLCPSVSNVYVSNLALQSLTRLISRLIHNVYLTFALFMDSLPFLSFKVPYM